MGDGGRGGWNIPEGGGGYRFLLNLTNGAGVVKINRGVGISKNPLILVMNEKKTHKSLILMLNLKVSNQTRSEASKNKVIIKRASITSIN